MEPVATEEIDQVLARIENCLKQIDASQGSMVRLRKCELDLLGQYEIARDLLSRVIRSGNRSLLREIAGPDCGRPGRLRAALAATRLSDMNARDQRFATCDGACASFEELTRRDLGAGDQLDKATSECKLELLVRRTSELLNPARVENSDDEGDDDEDEELGPGLGQAAPAGGGAGAAGAAAGGGGASAAQTEALAEARKLFDQIDRNGDGRVTKTELKRSVQRSFAIKKALKVRSMSECTRLFEEADLDSNGTLDYGEFEAWLRSALQMNASPSAQQRRAVDEEAARAAFASADRDCDGHLTVEELRFAYAGMLLSAGQKVSRKRVARWAARSIRKYDADNSRTLEFEEFFELLRKVRFADGLQLH